MSAAQALSSIPFAPPVAWALVHSVWQGGLLALALAAALSLLRGRSPRLRYALALAALLALPALMLLTAWRGAGAPAGTAGPAERTLGEPRQERANAAAVANPSRRAASAEPTARRAGAAIAAAGEAAAHRFAAAAADPASRGAVPGLGKPVVAPRWSGGRSAASAPHLGARVAGAAPGFSSALLAPARESLRLTLARARETMRPALPWLFAAWLCGVAALSLVQLSGWRRILRWRRQGTRPVADALQQALPRLCRRLGIERPIALLESAAVAVPAVVGWLRPLVLMPASALSGLTPQQLELVLAHELAHVRRHDYLVNLLQATIETLLFYHPAAWWISQQVRREREHCCDDLAVATCGNPVEYARTLAALAELRTLPARLAPAATGTGRGALLARIRRLLGSSGGAPRLASSWLAGALGLALLAMSAAVPLVGLTETAAARPARLVTLASPAGAAAPAVAATGDSIASSGSAVRTAPAAVAAVAADAADAAETGPAPAPEPRPTAEAWRGQWTAHRERDGASIWLQLTRHSENGHWSSSFTLPVDQLPGFASGPAVRFELRRDAGTFTFSGSVEGTGAKAEGSGSFTFQPDPRYAREMAALGYQVGEDRAFELAIHDVSLRFVREIHDLGYRDLPLDRLVEFKIHGVTPELIRGFAAHGYRDLPAERLIEFRIHGVTPDFVAALGTEGYRDVPAELLVELKIHGVSPEFVHELATLGYRNLPVDRLVELKIHGISPDLVRELNAQGYRELGAERLVELAIHGVTPAYLHELAALGYRGLAADRLVEFRIHGVSPDYLRELAAAGYPHVTPEALVSMRIHGVDAAFIRQMAARGYHDLSAEELVQLRIEGPDNYARRHRGN